MFKRLGYPMRCSCDIGRLDIAVRKNWESHIDAPHSRQPLVKGERLVRYEVNAVINNTLAFLHISQCHECVRRRKHEACAIDGQHFVDIKLRNLQRLRDCRRRPYRVECTGSLSTSEVKQHRARLVRGWGLPEKTSGCCRLFANITLRK